MALKKYNPVTPSLRQLVTVSRKDLHKGSSEKSLTVGLTKTGGRNNKGRITSKHIGGGHKKKYRIIDFKRNKKNINAEVLRFEYDPNRTAFVALIKYEDNSLSYIIAPQRLSVGDTIVASDKADIKVGNALPLKNIPVGTIIHNVENKPGKGGQYARSAGSYVQLSGKDSGWAQIKLRSGEYKLVSLSCMATIGAVSNTDHQNINDGKAGRSRWKGKRPTVRGVAMNPVDHPHGGGEGKTSGGRHPVNKNGLKTKGKKTRNNKATDKFILRKRGKK